LLTLFAFVVVTVLVFAAWLSWAAARLRGSAGEALACAGLLGAAQIVMTQILLGLPGWLNRPALLLANVLISAAMIAWSLREGPATRLRGWRTHAPDSGRADAIRLTSTALGLLALVLMAWMLAATWLLPPRGIDDLAYHLPPLFEYAQTGRLRLLPVEIRAGFAMPLGGDFLALWPLVLLGKITWIEFTQFAVALYGAGLLAALARALGASRPDALFAGLLFLLTPVVIGQAGSNYVDVIVAVSHLAMLFTAVRYVQDGRLAHILLAGLAAGFAIGVKYHLLAAVLAIQPLLWLRFARDGSAGRAAAHYSLYALAALPLPAYWYLRNLIVIGAPFYPYRLSGLGLKNIGGGNFSDTSYGSTAGSSLQALAEDPARFVSYLLQEPGLGTLNGGFGLAFWGLGLPALALVIVRAIRSAARRDFFPLLFWAQGVVFALIVLAQIDINRIAFNMRLMLVIVPLTLLALALLLPKLRRECPAAVTVIAVAGLLSAVLAIVQIPAYRLPVLEFRDAVVARLTGRHVSDFSYYRRSAGDLPELAAVWAPLDYLTRDGPGMTVYMGAAWPVYFSAPLFGESLRNTVLTLDRDYESEPDAFVFHPAGVGLPLVAAGRRYVPELVALGGRYEMIGPSSVTQLWISREKLGDESIRKRLEDYYARAFTGEIRALAGIAGRLPSDAVLITASRLGPALKYLAMTGGLQTEVQLAPEAVHADLARRARGKTVVTIGKPLDGFIANSIGQVDIDAATFTFYRNERSR